MATPRTRLTPEEKHVNDEKYRITVKEFSKVLTDLGDSFKSLVTLNTVLESAGKGSFLVYPNPNQGESELTFDRKQLRSANSLFVKEILSLKNYLRVAKKKHRKPVKPESFSGTYTPVYAGDALRAFFTIDTKRFGYVDPQNPSSGYLMDNLKMVQQGYLLRNTSTMLFYIYAHFNELQNADNAQYAHTDDIMTTAFGGNIPATYFSYRGNDNKIVKVPMSQAVGSIIETPANTFDIVTLLYPPGTDIKGNRAGFDPNNFHTYFFQNFAAANYYSKAALNMDQNLASVSQDLQNAQVRQAMLDEHNLVKDVSNIWSGLLEPSRKVQRDARKKAKDAEKRAEKMKTGNK